MAYYRFILLFFVALFFSCAVEHNEDVPIPTSILNKQQMIDILTECYLAEGAAGINVKSATGQQIDSVYLFNPIKDNTCSQTKFDSSITFYSQQPLLFKEIFDKVLEKINKISAKGKI